MTFIASRLQENARAKQAGGDCESKDKAFARSTYAAGPADLA
jgi:hypothetical protein